MNRSLLILVLAGASPAVAGDASDAAQRQRVDLAGSYYFVDRPAAAAVDDPLALAALAARGDPLALVRALKKARNESSVLALLMRARPRLACCSPCPVRIWTGAIPRGW